MSTPAASGKQRWTDANIFEQLKTILAGNYRVLGFELGATGHITSQWQVFAGYSYNDAEVVSSPNIKEIHNAPPNAPRHRSW